MKKKRPLANLLHVPIEGQEIKPGLQNHTIEIPVHSVTLSLDNKSFTIGRRPSGMVWVYSGKRGTLLKFAQVHKALHTLVKDEQAKREKKQTALNRGRK